MSRGRQNIIIVVNGQRDVSAGAAAGIFCCVKVRGDAVDVLIKSCNMAPKKYNFYSLIDSLAFY
jgi:hypothetical protein